MRVHATTVAEEKQYILHTLAEFVALVSNMQCACAILSSAACPAIDFNSYLTENTVCFYRENQSMNEA